MQAPLPLLHRVLLAVQTLLCLGSCAAIQPRGNDRPSIRTSSGVIQGIVLPDHPDVAQFLNVPYAESPTGNLRFAPPVAKSFAGNVDASQFGPVCLQYFPQASHVVFYDEFRPQYLPSRDTVAASSEDCLSLAIWTPRNATIQTSQTGQYANTTGSLPVLIFLYGGGFVQGGTNTEYYNAAPWIQRSQELIVVTINYRTAFVGTPNSAGLAAEQANYNFGLLDQRLAVEWVHNNIASFGGDPNKITLWGQSAGALSADYYNFAYPQDPLVTGFILSSGNAFWPAQNADTTFSNFTTAASHLGCGNLTAATELQCMRQVPFSQIKAYFQDPNVTTKYDFTPVIDGKTYFGHNNYPAKMAAGQFSREPVIMGTCTNEGTVIIPWDSPSLPPLDQLAQAGVVTQAAELLQVTETTARNAVGVITYGYSNNANFSDISPLPPRPAYEDQLSAYMQGQFLAFMKDPVKGPLLNGWPISVGPLVLQFDPLSSPNGPLLASEVVLL
ncbi:hypothetical protein PV08_00800 [Exophiala spinifera]|uniref:Carboxylic ester hydrolase n=1 Tax=Exophiala spinifera TaxID=91928 RepID=A0A0D2BNW7_9EURO|nr:uncharacterized protein PV08_00800 [Exophiala spinifera]KIW20225.1 hypothetical protein PV08_00800 [Exophiala spinifera]